MILANTRIIQKEGIFRARFAENGADRAAAGKGREKRFAEILGRR